VKAVICERYGPPDVLQIKDWPKPVAKDNELLIRVKAAEVTKADCELRSFNFPVKWFAFPLRLALGVFRPRNKILGGYFAGVVESVGAKVSKFKAGDEVYGCCRLRAGAHADYLCLPDSYTIAPKPKNLSFEQAAAVPLGGLNALHFIQLAELKPGERILINGAGGSIGTFAIQIALNQGVEVSVVDAAHKLTMLMKLGVDQFFDYTKKSFSESDQQWDVIFDMVAKSDLQACLRVLKPGGRYITANPSFKKMTSAGRNYKKTGKKVIFRFAGEFEQELLSLSSMLEAGQIRPVIDQVYPMAQAVEAHKRVESEERLGIVVLAIDS